MARRGEGARVVRLSRDAIVAAGVALADAEGLDAVSMRRLGQELGANPMSLYHHVRDKDALLEGMVDVVVAGIDAAEGPASDPWTERLRALLRAARRTALRHPWLVQVVERQQAPTAATLQHVDRVLGVLRGGGCSVELAHHALHLLGSRVLGFGQDLFDDAPSAGPTPADGASSEDFEAFAAAFPHAAELAAAVTHDGVLGGCDDDAEFEFALDLLLDGLERRRAAGSR